MGNLINGETGPDIKTAGTAGNEPSTKDTQPPANSGTGTGTGTGTPAPAKRSHKKKIVTGADLVGVAPEIVTVEIPEPSPGEAAPKRSHKKKPPTAPDLSQLEANIQMVSGAAFGMIGLVTNEPAIWQPQPGELENLSKPAARLVDRAGQLETTNKYADYFLLLGAAALMVIPRLIMMKQASANKRGAIPAEVINNGTTTNRSSGGADKQAAPGLSPDSQSPFDALYFNVN